MNPSVPLTRRSSSLSSSLGLGEKLFASPSDRRFVQSVDDGLEPLHRKHVRLRDERHG